MIKLLIVDDSALMRKLLEGIFVGQGDFEVKLARNGTEALELVHSFDPHGVESPEARRAAGKPEIATVTLAATRSGDRLVIEITDDGRGIDPEAMRRKAREGGASAAEEIDQLSDEEAIHLIFRPGFSTASKVSDISGRGVGMLAEADALVSYRSYPHEAVHCYGVARGCRLQRGR